MKVVIEGPEREVQKVIRENRLRAARGTIKMYPFSGTCEDRNSSQKAAEEFFVLKEENKKLIDENAMLKAKLDGLSDSKTTKENEDKVVEEADSKSVDVIDSKEVNEKDVKDSKKGKE